MIKDKQYLVIADRAAQSVSSDCCSCRFQVDIIIRIASLLPPSSLCIEARPGQDSLSWRQCWRRWELAWRHQARTVHWDWLTGLTVQLIKDKQPFQGSNEHWNNKNICSILVLSNWAPCNIITAGSNKKNFHSSMF